MGKDGVTLVAPNGVPVPQAIPPRHVLPRVRGSLYRAALIFSLALAWTLLSIFSMLAGGALVENYLYSWNTENLGGRLVILLAVALDQALVYVLVGPIRRRCQRIHEIEAMHAARLALPEDPFVVVPTLVSRNKRAFLAVEPGEKNLTFKVAGLFDIEAGLALLSAAGILPQIFDNHLAVRAAMAAAALMALYAMARRAKGTLTYRFVPEDVRRIEREHNLYRFRLRTKRLRLPVTFTVAIAPECQSEFDARLQDFWPVLQD